MSGENDKLFVQKLRPDAFLPKRGSEYAAGYDLATPDDFKIVTGEVVKVSLGLSIHIPIGYYGRIAPRSGLAFQGFSIEGGVIDSDYRGDVGILLRYHLSRFGTHLEREFKRGDRVAQLIIEKIINPEVVEVTQLSSTERGTGGFGSTGIN